MVHQHSPLVFADVFLATNVSRQAFGRHYGHKVLYIGVPDGFPFVDGEVRGPNRLALVFEPPARFCLAIVV